MDQNPPYRFEIAVTEDSGTELCAYRVAFGREANALKIFDFAVGEVTRYYDANRRAEAGE